ncbi:MAG: hypothetical protein RI601_05670 [Desulfurivibrionaceae bacterium]|nr:hypothetical protein [Desulfurivibrionaceae bacterium]
MGSDELSDQGDFKSKISDAVDDLFNAVRQIEIDPATNEVKYVGKPAPPSGEEAPALELESRPGSESAPVASAASPADKAQKPELLSKLDQALMTLDWEVSRSNAGNMRDLLDKVAREYDLGPLVGEGGIIALMHKLLAVMSDSPESVPTSGPLALKSSLTALTAAALEGQPYSAETRKQLEQAQNALLTVLPEQGGAFIAPQAASAAPPLPPAFQTALKNHSSRLEQLIDKRLIPVENFFGKTASLAKLHVVIKSVRKQLAEQVEELKGALAGRYGTGMPVSDPVSITIKVGKECQMLMQYHLQVLNLCARRIAPIEKMFADMEGQHKLHAIHYEIRSGLMAQLHYLAAALDGDFGPLPPLPKFAPAAPLSTPQAAGAAAADVSSSCPWSSLLLGRWGGEYVAFIPEQVCFEGPAGFGNGGIARQQSLRLKKLKSWPWSGLKAKFRGALAQKSNKELANLELPVLELPLSAAGGGGKHVVVLFQAAKGGVVVGDSPLETLEIDDQYSWSPSSSPAGDLVGGTISSDFGVAIPLIDVRRL